MAHQKPYIGCWSITAFSTQLKLDECSKYFLGIGFSHGFGENVPECRGESRYHHHHHHHHHHQSLNREGRSDTTDDFSTSFLHFALFSTALWDLPNSRPVHFLVLSSHLFLFLPCLLPPFTVPCKMVLARPDEQKT